MPISRARGIPAMEAAVPPAIDLAPRHLDLVLEILAAHAPRAEVWAYGSRVRGGAHEASDLDLALRNAADPERGLPGLAALRAAFRESRLPIFVDARDWARLPTAFRDEIARAHVVLRPGAR